GGDSPRAGQATEIAGIGAKIPNHVRTDPGEILRDQMFLVRKRGGRVAVAVVVVAPLAIPRLPTQPVNRRLQAVHQCEEGSAPERTALDALDPGGARLLCTSVQVQVY